MYRMEEKIIDETKQGEALVLENSSANSRKLYLESYGCQMNFSDSEIVASILAKEGYNTTSLMEEADLVLVNTCSIRDKAEQTVRKRLEKYNAVKKINPKMKVGVLGCMAERLKSKFLEEEKIVDMVVGPTPIRIYLIYWRKWKPDETQLMSCFQKMKPMEIFLRYVWTPTV